MHSYRTSASKPSPLDRCNNLFCFLGFHKLKLWAHRPYSHDTMFLIDCMRGNYVYVVGKSDFPSNFSMDMKPAKDIIQAFIDEYKKRNGHSPF